jgi:hypothetical protein
MDITTARNPVDSITNGLIERKMGRDTSHKIFSTKSVPESTRLVRPFIDEFEK